MKNQNRLQEAYKRAKYPVIGHGKRELQVLMDTLKDMDGTIESLKEK